jgi:hypothetical protein
MKFANYAPKIPGVQYHVKYVTGPHFNVMHPHLRPPLECEVISCLYHAWDSLFQTAHGHLKYQLERRFFIVIISKMTKRAPCQSLWVIYVDEGSRIRQEDICKESLCNVISSFLISYFSRTGRPCAHVIFLAPLRHRYTGRRACTVSSKHLFLPTIGPSTRTCFFHRSPSRAMSPFLKNWLNVVLVVLSMVTSVLQPWSTTEKSQVSLTKVLMVAYCMSQGTTVIWEVIVKSNECNHPNSFEIPFILLT